MKFKKVDEGCIISLQITKSSLCKNSVFSVVKFLFYLIMRNAPYTIPYTYIILFNINLAPLLE
ncbi:hypothetical protein SAMN05216323_103615 [Williamwhitmania taraxaci]|uniref:Uncharacterized protein n=1 Tax=Williamwhitmania taraxaci TaxID=1640674 RepID=A0A1G6MHW5_9BACT|nr:hypothetical protein SAMN05216323_103615 [Williamwhitmania taraxaci]